MGAAILTLLAGIWLVYNHGRVDLAASILFEIPVAYLFLWAICAFVVWLWRKLGAMTFLTLVLLSIVLVFMSLLLAYGTTRF